MIHRKNTILIVDDEQVNRVILKKILEKQYDVLEAENDSRHWTYWGKMRR